MELASIHEDTVELYLSRLIGIVSHPDMQKIQIIGFFFESTLIGSLKLGCYYLQYEPAYKPVDDILFEVTEAINVLCLIR